tara:strand:+ start:2665 stop:3477 length:813 start_codon:yes stop_codon:yes gene_type:complete
MYYGESIIDCALKPNKSYWSCYKERFVDFYFDSGYKPEDFANVTWQIAGAVNIAFAEYIIKNNISVGQTFNDLQSITNSQGFINWFYRETMLLNKYGGGVGITNGQWRAMVDNGVSGGFGFWIAMGFSNVREFYAYMAVLTAWAYGITKDNGYKTLTEDFVQKYYYRPSNIPEALYETPSSEDEKTMSAFGEDVETTVYPIWEYDIKPYLQGSKLERVRSAGDYELRNAKDTAMMAAQHKAFYDSEQTNWPAVVLGVLGAYLIVDRFILG